MIAFEVNDMTCGHCVSSITKAVKAVDPDARIDIDLARHLVQIEPGRADAQALGVAISDAGYSPQPVPAAQPAGAPAAAGGCGGGCGCH
jgi:copper chaperone